MTPRLFLPLPLASGATLVLPRGASRHVQVLRLQPGDAVVLFDGAGDVEWPAEIVRIERSAVELRVGAPVPVDRELRLRVTVAVGIPANERMDTLVEKATELGAAAIQPLLCERSVVRLAGDRAEARRRHWQDVAASASEQCGRVRVPEVGAPAKLGAWLRELDAGATRAARRAVLSFDPAAVAPSTLLAGLGATVSPGLVVLSGPEGGLAPAEEAAALAHGFVPIGLGPRVLRAETAPLALLAWLGLALESG
jgi:16S rRNA (uracil1498-N3)-methyltransferase